MNLAATSESIHNPRRHINVLAERVTHVSSVDYPGHFVDEDHSWNLEEFNKKLNVKVQRLSQRSIEFDLVGVDASISNAFRRIMIAEVPTVTVENVFVFDNTSIMHDEILSSRIGLIPLHVDPRKIEMRTDQNLGTDRNTLVFRVCLECSRNKNAPKGATADDVLYMNHELRSSHLQWQPQGEQAEVFAHDPPRPTNPDIVLTKLRPGQVVEIEMHAVKGIGSNHAKFSPVATASYRLLPLILLNPEKPVPPESAEKFASCFAPGVIRIDPKTRAVSVDEQNMRRDTVSREVLRHPEFEGCVELKRVRDFFLFNVETESFYRPEELLPEAIKIMRNKIATIKKAAEALLDDVQFSGSRDRDIHMADS